MTPPLKRKWVEKNTPCSFDEIRGLAERLGISPLLARLLANRGIADETSARAYFGASLDDLNSPFQLADMDKAVERIRRAAAEKETVLVYGDRDVDGITGSVLLVELVKELGLPCLLHEPLQEEGYGFLPDRLAGYRGQGATLALVVDCGIRDFPAAEEAQRLGIDLIICDHHEPDEGGLLPPAVAVIDPKRTDCVYPYPYLCGCAVAFKLAQAVLFSEDRTYNRRVVYLTAGEDGENLCLASYRNGVELNRIELAGASENKSLLSAFEILKEADKIVADKAQSVENALVRSFPSLKKAVGKKELVKVVATAVGSMIQQDVTIESLSRMLGMAWNEALPAPERLETLITLHRRVIARRNARMQNFLKRSLDLTVLATLVDVVELKGENRGLVRGGMHFIERSGRVGLRILMRLSLRGAGALSTKDVTWSLGPILNSAGRLGCAALAQKLLLARTEAEAEPLARELVALNHKRKLRLKENTEACLRLAEEQYEPGRDALVIIEAEGLEPGVTGIVATRLMERFGRPTLILLHDEKREFAVGSMRSAGRFDWVAALGAVEDLLERFGGHTAAAGITLRSERVPELRKRLQSYAADRLDRDEELLLELDALLNPDEIGDKLIQDLLELEPFGAGNETPLFGLLSCSVLKASRIGSEKQHLALELSRKGKSFRAVAWNRDEPLEALGTVLDVAFTVERDIYRGGVQLVLEDFRPSE